MLWEVALAPDYPVWGREVSGSPELFTGAGPRASGFCVLHTVSKKYQRKPVWYKVSAPRPLESSNCGRPHLKYGRWSWLSACLGGAWHVSGALPISQVSILS